MPFTATFMIRPIARIADAGRTSVGHDRDGLSGLQMTEKFGKGPFLLVMFAVTDEFLFNSGNG